MKKTAMRVSGVLLLAVLSTLAFTAAKAAPNREPAPSSTKLSAASANIDITTWNFDAYKAALSASDRALGGFTERQFQAVQDRKQAVLDAIRGYLIRRFGHADESVMAAFREVPREYFMYDYERNRNLAASAYERRIREWPIGYGSTLSDYFVQAYMTQSLKPKPTEVSLEVGTGSGFQSSILSRIVKQAYTIEIITALGRRSDKVFEPLGFANVHTRVGDGFYGWPEVEGGFDIIIVTAAAPFVPPRLLAQLKKGGRMIIPIGQPYRKQFLYFFTKDEEGKIHSRKDISVLFIPMTGQVTKGM